MSYESPPAETRQCSSCGRTLSLNFFGLDTRICRKCEMRSKLIEADILRDTSETLTPSQS